MFELSWESKVNKFIWEVSELGMDYVGRYKGGNTFVFTAITDSYFVEDVKYLLDRIDFIKSYSFTQEELSNWSDMELEGDDNSMDILTVELKEEN